MTTVAVPSRQALLAVWILTALVLGGILVAARVLRMPGDDVDPGRQRPGILDLGPLPEPAPEVAGVALPPGRRSVVFFARADSVAALCQALSDDEALRDESVVILSGTRTSACAPRVRVTQVDVRVAANAFGLPRPRGDVAPTGYAIVDRRGQIRYRTLDPVAPALLDEVATMLRAVG